MWTKTEQQLDQAEFRHVTGLYPHQVEGIAFLTRKGRAILGEDMGLGKTRQAIVAMNEAQGASCCTHCDELFSISPGPPRKIRVRGLDRTPGWGLVTLRGAEHNFTEQLVHPTVLMAARPSERRRRGRQRVWGSRAALSSRPPVTQGTGGLARLAATAGEAKPYSAGWAKPRHTAAGRISAWRQPRWSSASWPAAASTS